MATLATITATLMELNQLYQRNIPNEAIKTIATAWCEDLEKLTDADFLKAVQAHRKNCPYWPTPSHILAAARDLTPRYAVLALPSAPPRRTEGVSRVVSAAYRGRISWDRAREFFGAGEGVKREILREVGV